MDEFVTSKRTFPKGMGKFNTMRIGNVSVRVYATSNKFVRYDFINRERYFDITTKNLTMSQATQVIESLIK